MKLKQTAASIGLLLTLACANPLSAAPLAFELVSSSFFTSPYAMSTSDIYHDERIGDSYINNIGFSTYAADFIVMPEQWAIDAILNVLGVDDSSDILIHEESLTLSSFTTVLRLTGDAGARAEVTGTASVSGVYNQLFAAVPSGETSSSVSFDYTLAEPGITGSEELVWSDSGLAGEESGAAAGAGTALSPFEMAVGDTLSLTGAFSVSSYAQVNPACVTVCIPFTDLCHTECLPGVGFAFAYTDGLGGIALDLTEVPVPEPATPLLLSMGLLGILYHRTRTGMAAGSRRIG